MWVLSNGRDQTDSTCHDLQEPPQCLHLWDQRQKDLESDLWRHMRGVDGKLACGLRQLTNDIACLEQRTFWLIIIRTTRMTRDKWNSLLADWALLWPSQWSNVMWCSHMCLRPTLWPSRRLNLISLFENAATHAKCVTTQPQSVTEENNYRLAVASYQICKWSMER